MSDVSDFDFWLGEWNVHNRRLRERLAGSDEWEEFEATSEAWPILGGLGNEDVFRTDHDGGFVGMSFRFFDPTTRRVVDLLGRQPPAGAARPAGGRLVLGRHRRLRGRRHVQGPADPRPLHLVAGDDAEPALGAGVLGRRRRDLGDELGQRLHTRQEATDERRPGRLPAPDEGDRAGAADRARRQRAQVVRHRPCRRARAGADPGARAREPPRGGRVGRDRARGRPRLRDPAPLRRELLLPARLDLAQRQRALGDGLGEERRRHPASVPGRSRGRTARRSASGSSARSGTSSRRGAASSARSATQRPGRRTCSDSYAGEV